jgi:hypothetical protein
MGRKDLFKRKVSILASRKIVLCIHLMNTLLEHGSISLNQIASFEDVDEILLMKNLSFLVEQGFAKKEKYASVITFAITDCGSRALSFFQNPTLP